MIVVINDWKHTDFSVWFTSITKYENELNGKINYPIKLGISVLPMTVVRHLHKLTYAKLSTMNKMQKKQLYNMRSEQYLRT